ncbi:hypothetical protein ACWDZ4_26790 [Streptomyces sp. NPDC003016]
MRTGTPPAHNPNSPSGPFPSWGGPEATFTGASSSSGASSEVAAGSVASGRRA